MAVTESRQTLFSASIQTLALTADGAVLLDQTVLPGEVRYVTIRTPEEMREAIRTMIVRGAPAIGIAGAYGMVLGARAGMAEGLCLDMLKQQLGSDAAILRESRPTAVNLMWALDQMLGIVDEAVSSEELLARLTEKAEAIRTEDLAACKAMGDYGATLVPAGARILTHCNAGGLATAGYGTALGVIRSAFAADPTVTVYADETRPRLQGARLTAWELHRDGIPVTLVSDNMSGHLMKKNMIDLVVVGSDRIAANGDIANKIGTYNLAVLCRAHNIPFYVAAPLSTIDINIASGEDIPIEERNPEELYQVGAERIAPEGIGFYNPAFDVTPAEYVTAIVTEKGIARPDYRESLQAFFS